MSAALKTPELTKEALEFVRGNKPGNPIVSVAGTTTPPSQETPREEIQKPPAPSSPRATTKAPATTPNVVSFSTRISSALHESLMRASFDRKLARQDPWTHQEIVTEALTAWLRRNGYASS